LIAIELEFVRLLCYLYLQDQGVPLKFRVENSWGDDRGEKGYFLMTADWYVPYDSGFIEYE